MQTSETNIMFIGLIFDIVLAMFVVVAVLLIYSLLMISVETKTYEIGIMRLVGLTKLGFVGMIFTQSVCFVLPSLLSGFICSIPCIWIIYSLLFSSGPKPTPLPGMNATLQALFIGLVIPTLSAIIPVRKALGVNLAESLNTQRKGNENQLVKFHDSKKLNIVPYLLFGLIGSGFGLAIYIMLPLSLLK